MAAQRKGCSSQILEGETADRQLEVLTNSPVNPKALRCETVGEGTGTNRKAMEEGRSQVKEATQATLKEIRLS